MGIFLRLSFLECVTVQILLETAMHNYTALSVGETILIDVGGTKHWLDVVETRPEPAISLLGSIDLEVEFAPPRVRHALLMIHCDAWPPL